MIIKLIDYYSSSRNTSLHEICHLYTMTVSYLRYPISTAKNHRHYFLDLAVF